jgi:hypothetical protein
MALGLISDSSWGLSRKTKRLPICQHWKPLFHLFASFRRTIAPPLRRSPRTAPRLQDRRFRVMTCR